MTPGQFEYVQTLVQELAVHLQTLYRLQKVRSQKLDALVDKLVYIRGDDAVFTAARIDALARQADDAPIPRWTFPGSVVARVEAACQPLPEKQQNVVVDWSEDTLRIGDHHWYADDLREVDPVAWAPKIAQAVAELVAQMHRERDAAEQAARDCDRLGRDMGVVMNERDDLRVQTTHLRGKLSELKPALDQMAEDLRAVQQSRHEAEDRAQCLQSELGLAVERHIAVTNELSSVRSKYTALVARLESVVKP